MWNRIPGNELCWFWCGFLILAIQVYLQNRKNKQGITIAIKQLCQLTAKARYIKLSIHITTTLYKDTINNARSERIAARTIRRTTGNFRNPV
jgi:hypothetical protein